MKKVKIVAEDEAEHVELFGNPSPPLELSSDSESEEETAEKDLIDLTPGMDGNDTVRLSEKYSKELLATAAALTFRNRRQESVTETRSSFSSPGKTNFTLREKLNRLTRAQRKELLVRTGTSMNVQRSSRPNEDQAQVSPKPVTEGPENDSDDSLLERGSLLRLKRQAQYNNSQEQNDDTATRKQCQQRHTNHVRLNIYDLIAHDTLMQLPWGCICEIGKCFTEVNSALHELGTGAYHVGVEINGIEYAYGATSTPGKSGVFSCIPKCSPGYQYRTSIDFGERPLTRKSWIMVPNADGKKPSTVFEEIEEFVDGRQLMREMAAEFKGIDYDILRRNCCTFAREACIRLNVKEEEIPTWFCNLAESGAFTQDTIDTTFNPIRKVLSACEEDRVIEADYFHGEDGFEVIAKRNSAGTRDIVVVVDARPNRAESKKALRGVRRMTTWAY